MLLFAKAFPAAKTPAASATAPTPSSGLRAKAVAIPAKIADAFKALYARIKVFIKAIVAVTPAVILEITKQELNDKTFDGIWDEIRKVYTEEEYQLLSHEVTHNGMIIEFILYRKKFNQMKLGM